MRATSTSSFTHDPADPKTGPSSLRSFSFWLGGVFSAHSAQGQSPELAELVRRGGSRPRSGNAAPLTITFQDALQRAKNNEPQYRSALTDLGVARGRPGSGPRRASPRRQLQQFIYLHQGTGLPASTTSKFIANNGVHEYLSQADVHQSLSLTGIADYRRSAAALVQARAKAEIAARGLVVTVTQAYYGLVVAQRKYATAQRAPKPKPSTSSTSARNWKTAGKWPMPT